MVFLEFYGLRIEKVAFGSNSHGRAAFSRAFENGKTTVEMIDSIQMS